MTIFSSGNSPCAKIDTLLRLFIGRFVCLSVLDCMSVVCLSNLHVSHKHRYFIFEFTLQVIPNLLQYRTGTVSLPLSLSLQREKMSLFFPTSNFLDHTQLSTYYHDP